MTDTSVSSCEDSEEMGIENNHVVTGLSKASSTMLDSTISPSTSFGDSLSQSTNDSNMDSDTFVQDKLNEWNLSEYIEIFENEKVDKFTFLNMPDEGVAQLIKPMGHYYKFILRRDKIKLPEQIHSRSKASRTAGGELRGLLRRSAAGKFLLRQTSLLNNSKEVAKIIIDNLLNDNTKLKVPKQKLIFWAQEIVGVWPEEDAEKWYRPSGQNRTASGKLYHYLTNKLKKIKAAVLNFEAEQIKEEESEIQKKAEDYISELAVTSLDNVQKILFLWEQTFKYRKTCSDSIAEYFGKYPQLRTPFAVELIELDFKLSGVSCTDALEKKWPTLYPQILKIATKQPAAKRVLEALQSVENVAPEVLSWKVFPYLFKPVLMKAGPGKKPWKPSYPEQSDAFITWINVITDFEKAVSKQRHLMEERKLTLQPFIIAVGPIDNLQAVYVIINDQKYQFSNVASAVDFCWKSMFVLNAAYPVACEPLWTYIQEDIYNYQETGKKTYQSVIWVRDALNNLRLETADLHSPQTSN